MRYSWIAIAIILIGGAYLAVNRPAPEPQAEVEPTTKLVRLAKGLNMQETDLAKGDSLNIKAQQLTETGDNLVKLENFTLIQNEATTISGKEAVYDTAGGIITIAGALKVDSSDGMHADMDGLVWDRNSGEAQTDNPVAVQNGSTRITASRAEFRDNFSEISFVGNVNAKINKAYFNP